MAEPRGQNGISLREYIDIILRNQSRLHKQRIDAMDMALRLQAKEYERRLESLNHAHQQQIDTLATYVPREMWQERHTSLERSIEALGAKLKESHSILEARVTKIENGIAKIMAYGVAISGVLLIAIAVLEYLRGK